MQEKTYSKGIFMNQAGISSVEEDILNAISAQLPWHLLEGKHVLISGASGFIGGHLVEMLAYMNKLKPSGGVNIYALARDKMKLRSRFPMLKAHKDYVPVIKDVQRVWRPITPIDFIIHAASPSSPKKYVASPVQTILANTVGTQNMLELARKKNSKLLFLSTGAVYGKNTLGNVSIKEHEFGGDDPLDPRACYAESKRLAESLCRSYYTQYGVDARIARISHCYGPGMQLDDGRAITDILCSITSGNQVHLDSNGEATRPFCYISDTISGLFHILLKGAAGEAYNVGSTEEISILALAQKMLTHIPYDQRQEIKINKAAMPQASRDSGYLNVDKLRGLGWKPIVDLDSGIKKMIDSYLLLNKSPW
jgi:dTDP-glucose 4,6-dehydratase